MGTGHHPMFPPSFYFFFLVSESLKLFGNSWGNSYRKIIILRINFRFTCGKSKFRGNIINSQNISSMIVGKCMWQDITKPFLIVILSMLIFKTFCLPVTVIEWNDLDWNKGNSGSLVLFRNVYKIPWDLLKITPFIFTDLRV